MSRTAPAEIHRWARELLGGRGYLRAMNDSAQRARIEHIADALESGQLDPGAVRAAFANAAGSKRGIDQLFAEIEELTVRRMPLPERRRSGPTSADIDRLNAEIAAMRNHARDLEELVRSLAERSVLDATRIKGLESALIALAQTAGVGPDLQALYGTVTADFLARRKLIA